MREGWEQTTLGKALQVNPKMGKLSDSAPFVTMSDVHEWGRYAYPSGEKGTRGGIRAQGGDVLFARITPCLENGKIGKLPQSAPPTGGSTEFIVLRGSEKATSDFAFLLAQSRHVHSSAVSLMTGSTGRQRVAATDLARIPIALPPLHEQRRIVDLMDSVDAAISAAQAEVDAAVELLRTVRNSYFAQAEGASQVEDEFLVDAGKPLNKRDIGKKDTVLVPYLRAGSIDEGFLNLDVMKEMPYSEADLRSKCLLPGDVVLVEGGNGYGKSAVWNGELSGSIGFQNHVIRLRAKTPSPEATRWIFHWTRWSHQSGRFRPTGTGLPNMGLKPVRSAVLPRISIAELHVLDGIETTKSAAQTVLDRLRDLRASMLSVLLSGEHDIPESYDQFLAESIEAQVV